MLFRTIKQKFIGMSVGLLATLALVFFVVSFLLTPVKQHWSQYKSELVQRNTIMMQIHHVMNAESLGVIYTSLQQDQMTPLTRLLNQLAPLVRQYQTTGQLTQQEQTQFRKLASLLSSGSNTRSAAEASGQLAGISSALNEIGVINHRHMQELESQLDHEFEKILQYLAIFLLVALMMGATVFTLVSRVITTPLADMQKLMGRIARDNDLTLRMEIKRQDEVGDTSQAINDMLDRFRMLIRQVLGSSARLLTEVDQMNVASVEAKNSMDVQSRETDMVAASMNEMSTTVKMVADNASAAASSADQAQSEARQGKEVVELTISSIDSLAKEVGRAAEVIHRLESDSESIGMVVDVIRDIAEQTNLLALNAAIEAARAGEQGRGFAVVADEVRTLASRTQESTQEIQQMIERLQKAAAEAVGVMEDGQREADSVVGHAAQAGESLQSIMASVSTIVDMNTLIASSATQQNITADEMNRNLAHISEMASTTSTGALQTVDACEKTVRQVEGLRLITAQFKAGESSLDLSSFKAGHFAWKPRLAAFMQGKYDIEEAALTDHTQCELGKWYYSEGKQNYASFSKLDELERIHADMHEQIHHVVEHQHAGNSEQAQAAYEQMSRDTEQLGALIDAWEIHADRK